MSEGLTLRSLLPGKESGKKRKQRKAEPTGFSRVLLQAGGFFFRRIADVVLIVLLITGFFVFKRCYYTTNPAFLVNPADIEIRGNVTLKLEDLKTTFGWNRPMNGFDFVCSEVVAQLKKHNPLIKDIQMTYMPGGKLSLWVEERMPLARLTDQMYRCVVDEEGVVFRYDSPCDGYPEIRFPEKMNPGSRLPASFNCILHLLAAAAEPETRLPSSIRHVTLLGSDVDDGLLVLLADGRRVRIAWEGMATEVAYSDGMLRRLRNLARVLNNELMLTKRDFNAMAADRVTVVDEEWL